MGYCDVFISCLDSNSDGTHSLQRIHVLNSFSFPFFFILIKCFHNLFCPLSKSHHENRIYLEYFLTFGGRNVCHNKKLIFNFFFFFEIFIFILFRILFIFNLLSRKCKQEGDVRCIMCTNINSSCKPANKRINCYLSNISCTD